MSKKAKNVPVKPVAPRAVELEVMQRWVQEVVMHPEGAEAGVNSKNAKNLIGINSNTLDKVILPSKNLTSLARINIYAQAYYWRLMDIMASDFFPFSCLTVSRKRNKDELGIIFLQSFKV